MSKRERGFADDERRVLAQERKREIQEERDVKQRLQALAWQSGKVYDDDGEER